MSAGRRRADQRARHRLRPRPEEVDLEELRGGQVKSFRERNPATLAVIGTVVIIAMLALAFNAKRLPFIGNGPTYYADFTDASGLSPGEEVRIAGLKVGEVSSISIAGTHVRIGFHVKGAAFGPQT